ncbi:MAG: hypothetical protein ACRBBQ_11685 [Cognatishimia sp.]
MSIEESINEYIRRFRKSANDEREFFEKRENLHDAISAAAKCVMPSGSKHPHQYRIPVEVLAEAERCLLSLVNKIGEANDFDSLYSVVSEAIRPIHGIGELCVYDISHRIGSYRKLEVNKVYLHAGAQKGAAALGLKGRTIERTSLPTEFARLTAAEIEDCLCIFKDRFDEARISPVGCSTIVQATGCSPSKKFKTRTAKFTT